MWGDHAWKIDSQCLRPVTVNSLDAQAMAIAKQRAIDDAPLWICNLHQQREQRDAKKVRESRRGFANFAPHMTRHFSDPLHLLQPEIASLHNAISL